MKTIIILCLLIPTIAFSSGERETNSGTYRIVKCYTTNDFLSHTRFFVIGEDTTTKERVKFHGDGEYCANERIERMYSEVIVGDIVYIEWYGRGRIYKWHRRD